MNSKIDVGSVVKILKDFHTGKTRIKCRCDSAFFVVTTNKIFHPVYEVECLNCSKKSYWLYSELELAKS